MFKGEYPPNWKAISRECRRVAGDRCIRCNHVNDIPSGHVLTTHHFNGDKSNQAWWNLLALCQRCHLSFQSRVDPEQPYMFEHSEWIKPYVAAFYAWKYEQKQLTRAETMARLEELLAYELRT